MTPEEIARAREELGLNVMEFAKVLNVTHGAVSLWESGSRRMRGSVEVLVRVLVGTRQRALADARSMGLDRTSAQLVVERRFAELGVVLRLKKPVVKMEVGRQRQTAAS